jgi:hypothetical protein
MPLFSGLYAQDIDPQSVIDSASNKFQRVISYTAEAIIDLDVDFIQMPSKKVNITYEYPNKLDIDSKGFVMVPKYGLKPLIKTLAKEDNIIIFAGRETIEDKVCYIIKLLPRVDGRIIMMKLWIRTDDYLIARTETFTRRSGSFLIDFSYEDLILPSSMVFSFEASGINIPWRFIGNSIEIDKEKMKEDEIKMGKVFINFSNYQIEYSK